MIVDNFNVGHALFGPNEANPELIVEADGVLALAVAAQGFEAISRRHPEILKLCCFADPFEPGPSRAQWVERMG